MARARPPSLVFETPARELKMLSEPPAPSPSPPAPAPAEIAVEIVVESPLPVEPAVDRPTAPSLHRQRARVRWPLRIALLLVIVGGELVLADQSGAIRLPRDVREARAMLTLPSTAPAAAPAVAVAAISEAKPEVTSEPPSAAPIPARMGRLDTRGARPGHRIFVNDRTVGETPAAVLAPCGTASVKLGSSGRARTIDIPCGDALVLDDP